MIEIRIIRDSEGFIWEFSVKGHAGFDEYGKDIVCAAVSAVAYTALGAMDELADIRNFSEKDGYIKCSVPADIHQDKKYTVKIILETMAIGLKQIKNSYKDYIRIMDEEV